jgi:hypothetical protein
VTGALLDLTELAARAGVPAERLRHYAEVGLLPPAHDAEHLPGEPIADPDQGRTGPFDGAGLTPRAA